MVVNALGLDVVVKIQEYARQMVHAIVLWVFTVKTVPISVLQENMAKTVSTRAHA